MSERFISSVHIQKLGHKLQEIRERALLNIISKLERGFIYDNDLARCKEILSRLFEWFSFDPCTCQEDALKLMRFVLQSPCGDVLIKHYGSKWISSELKRIRSLVGPELSSSVEEIVKLVQECMEVPLSVPPLASEVPLSYRSYDSGRPPIESTATTIEGFVQYDSSLEQQIGVSKQGTATSSNDGTAAVNFTFKWQPLIAPDRHVLESVEQALRNPTEPMALLHSCEFFNEVILQDFPAETFLQRPAIVLLLQEYLKTSVSKRIAGSVLNCLHKLTDYLINRIFYCGDPHLSNSKEVLTRKSPTNTSPTLATNIFNVEHSYIHSARSWDSNLNAEAEDRALLESRQLLLPEYCFIVMQCVLEYLHIKPEGFSVKKRTQSSTNLALMLLEKLVHLSDLCLTPNAWEGTSDASVLRALRKFEEALLKFADALEHFSRCYQILNNNLYFKIKTLDRIRLETISNDCDASDRMIHLCLLCNCTNLLLKLVPLGKANTVLPRPLKNTLASTLLDPVLTWTYPNVHETVLQFVTEFGSHFEAEALEKYRQVRGICDSLAAAVQLLRNWKSLPPLEAFQLAREAMPSLEFHKNISFVSIVIDLCTNTVFEGVAWDISEECILRLLAHNDPDVQEETYRLCCGKVIAAAGPKLNAARIGVPGYQIVFLLRPRILIEICLHGIADHNPQIVKYANDILIHVLKCKILVSEDVWNKAVSALIAVLPVLTCYAGRGSALGRAIIEILDPDTAVSQFIPKLEMVRGNLRLLFVEEASAREEAISRLCWLLSSQENSRALLPHLNSLQDKSLNVVCQLQRPVDVNKMKTCRNFYQPSTLLQVLDLLKSSNVEPVIRRSAVTQISVMLEDHLLHHVFVENDGLRTIVNVMKSALTENCYDDYVDCIIPAVTGLKNVCLFNASVRHELANDVDVYFYILRGLFVFCAEDRMRHDCTVLLFLLLFNDCILGSQIKADFSLPYLIMEKLSAPITCNSHWRTSPHCSPSLAVTLLSDKWCLTYIQIQFNSEWFGGFSSIIKWKEVKEIRFHSQFNRLLNLSDVTLLHLKNSSLSYSIMKCLTDIQNGTLHDSVIESVAKLQGCLELYTAVKDNCQVPLETLLEFPWERSFGRILNAPPANTQDAQLLTALIRLLTVLISLYSVRGEPCWIIATLKSPSHYLPNLLQVDSSAELELKTVHRELLSLITACVWQEQNYLDLHTIAKPKELQSGSWGHVIGIIAGSLKFNDTQHFYNLAYLENSLSSLVHLTTALGWSKNKAKEPLVGLILSLCELLNAFHCGKGASTTSSVMGLSVTRHVLLILNHLLTEMQSVGVKDWEKYFLRRESEGNIVHVLSALWPSRDVIVRAAILQLLAGLALSPRMALEFVHEVRAAKTGKGVWEACLAAVLDHEEASVVRENAAALLCNLIGHVESCGSDGFTFVGSLRPITANKGASAAAAIFDLLNAFKFFKELHVILTSLCKKTSFCVGQENASSDSNQNSARARSRNALPHFTGRSASSKTTGTSDAPVVTAVTPSLVRALAVFVRNLLSLMPREIPTALQESGALKLFFKCLTDVPRCVETPRDLSFYCEVLEMNASICALLGNVIKENNACYVAILHTRDCLSVLFSLLDPSTYSMHLLQLHYLRNQLWTEVLNLIGAFLNTNRSGINTSSSEALNIISVTLGQCGQRPFLQTLCEAISCSHSADLQQTALTSLTSLLVTEIKTHRSSPESSRSFPLSMQNLLDNVRTPRTLVTIDSRDDTENIEAENAEVPRKPMPSPLSSAETSTNILSEIYFGKVTPKLNELNKMETVRNGQRNKTNDESLAAGSELCRILLQLYEMSNFKTNTSKQSRRKEVIVNTLASILCVSGEAKRFALRAGFMETIVWQLKSLHIKLSLESVSCLRRVIDKRRVSPVLKELGSVIGLSTNFMLENDAVKSAASVLGFADLIHKLWVWFCVDRSLLCDVLKMLCTYTTDCYVACQSLPLTSSATGSGPRKTPSSLSLLHEMVALVFKEMEQISRTHVLTHLELVFHVLHNSCASVECRTILAKSNLLQFLSRLHPANTKRQKPWENVEAIWLEFLLTFTGYPEGQAHVAKSPEALELIMTLTSSPKVSNRRTAMLLIRNLTFYRSNRPRLLNSGDFLNILQTKLTTGTPEEINITVTMMWALIANNHRAKLVLKCAGLDVKLQESIKRSTLSVSEEFDADVMELMSFVLSLLKDDEKGR